MLFMETFYSNSTGILKMEKKIWVTNMISTILGAYYSSQFVKFCSPKASNLPGTKSQHKLFSTIIMLFTVLSAVVLPVQLSSQMIGLMGVFFCIILFGSPLSSLKEVIATKSAKSIPLPFTLACVMNCLLWSIFGTFEVKDFNIYFPNILGLLLGLVQLGLLAVYGSGPPKIYEDRVQLPL